MGVAANVAYLAYSAFSGAPAGEPASVREAPGAQTSRARIRVTREANQTNVYPSEDLVLVNAPGRRLLLSPLISVSSAGGAESQTVHLRFYSYSGRWRYHADTDLRIAVDGEDVWAGKGLILSFNAGEHGEAVESLGSYMSLGEFARAFGGAEVTMTLGPERVDLSPGQLEALRHMLRCARGQACG